MAPLGRAIEFASVLVFFGRGIWRLGNRMKNSTTLKLYNYWNDVRSGRFAPHRFDIEPSRISEILPETLIIERHARNQLRFRLAGTAICERFGNDFRGTDFLTLFPQGETNLLAENLSVMARQGAVGLFHIQSTNVAEQTTTGELILLPLVHSPQSVDRYLGAWSQDPTTELPADSPPPNRHSVLDYELIWPRGRPAPIAASHEQPLPLSSNIRHARIVRDERRQFRVYDGGLS